MALARVSFTEQDVRNAASRDQLALGWYAFLVKEATCKISQEKGHCMIAVRLAPLEREGDPTSAVRPHVFHNLILPFANADKDGHKAPNTAGLCAEFLYAALSDDLVRSPTKDANGTWIYNGEEISPKEIDKCKFEALQGVFDVCAEMWENEDCSRLIDTTFYALVADTVDKNDSTKTYRNATKFCVELPADATLVPVGKFVEKQLALDSESESAPAAKPASKPAAKPAPKSAPIKGKGKK